MSVARILICDDEPLAVARLVSMLSRLPDVEVVATSTSGRQAIGLIAEARPDLLLIDIEMPEVDGFDVVEEMASLEAEQLPLVAFVTAYRRFAPQAFDSGAIDFLSKPVRLNRLAVTLHRAREALAGREAKRRLEELQGMLGALRNNHDPEREAHIWVPRRGEMIRVDLERIDRVAAEGAYVRLHVGTDSFLHREAIGAIELRLDSAKFQRVHRSHLLRLDHVASIRRTIHGGGELILQSGERIPLGRKYARVARLRLLACAPER